jgi:stringent starvation protein B
VKDGEIVLNISFDATSSLKLGNDFIEFKGRFAGTARDIAVPINQVIAIYARENGQGMAFPVGPARGEKLMFAASNKLAEARDDSQTAPEVKLVQLAMVESAKRSEMSGDETDPPRPVTPGPRTLLKRVK